MIDYLIDTSLGVGLIILIALTIVFSLTIYLAFHYLIRQKLKKSHERVGRVLFRVAASLLALILSISFANQRVDYFKLKDSIESEAAAIVDLYVDLSLYNTAESSRVLSKLTDYVFFISDDEWQSLHEEPFRSKPFTMFREIYHDLAQLETQTPLHEQLKDNILSDIDLISDYLQVRLYSSRERSNPLIYTCIFGLTAIMILFTVYPPDRITIGFLSIYAAFVGLVLYFIVMMSNPVKGPLQVDPGPFLLLKEAIEANR